MSKSMRKTNVNLKINITVKAWRLHSMTGMGFLIHFPSFENVFNSRRLGCTV